MANSRELDWLRYTAGALALRDRAVIAVSGDDALEWLQGQVTNDLKGIAPGKSAYGFVLTLKGRVMADVWVLGAQDEVWLDVPSAEVDRLLERLDRYVIMEDVDLAHRPELRLLTVQGPKSEEVSPGGWPSDRLGSGGQLWVVDEAEVEPELHRLTEQCQSLGGGPVHEQVWAEAHVAFGRPRFGTDFGDWTYPQETGLAPVAISFTKGCYVGQETVVMLQNRGKAPKVLWRWAIDGTETPEAKTPIEHDGTVIGEITSAAQLEDGIAALGFVKRGHESGSGAGFVVGGAAACALGRVDEGPGVGRSIT